MLMFSAHLLHLMIHIPVIYPQRLEVVSVMQSRFSIDEFLFIFFNNSKNY